jgi:membrane protease subunit HflK
MYLETMERLFNGTDKIIMDSGSAGQNGVVPYLPLNELARPPAARPATPAPNPPQSVAPAGGAR